MPGVVDDDDELLADDDDELFSDDDDATDTWPIEASGTDCDDADEPDEADAAAGTDCDGDEDEPVEAAVVLDRSARRGTAVFPLSKSGEAGTITPGGRAMGVTGASSGVEGVGTPTDAVDGVGE